MGFFGLGADTRSPSHESPRASSDGAFIAPDRTARSRCWDARDAFFRCLDEHGIVDSIKDKDAAQSACGMAEQDLRAECASSWVTYFKQRRVMEHNKQTLLDKLANEGAEKIDQPLPQKLTRKA